MKKQRKLNVYGGSYNYKGKSYRVIVAATSMDKVVSLLPSISLKYWSVTGNAAEIRTATAKPNKTFYIPEMESYTQYPTFVEGLPGDKVLL